MATEETATAFSKIDILVNNAGITGGNAKTWEIDPADWRRVMEINLNGPFYGCRCEASHLLKNGYGRVVNIASIAGKEGNPNAAHYSASKAAVIALTKSLGKELATSNISVNAVAPTVIETEILKQMQQSHIDYMLSKIPMGRFEKKKKPPHSWRGSAPKSVPSPPQPSSISRVDERPTKSLADADW